MRGERGLIQVPIKSSGVWLFGVAVFSALFLLAACSDAGGEEKADSVKIGRVRIALDATSLAHAAGGVDGSTYEIREAAQGGVLLGRVSSMSVRDTLITPTVDEAVCSPFQRQLAAGASGGVPNAAVWLVGVAAGPGLDGKRRLQLALKGCKLDPYMQVAIPGSTILVSSGDAMMSRIRFDMLGTSGPSLESLLFSDAGQVVPTSRATEHPGLVRISDDKHPWISGWLLVSPHPFVALTGEDGSFRMENVPAGQYQLVVWHEYLGTRHLAVTVREGVQTAVEIEYPGLGLSPES